ncbi:MAG: hypothetical protein J6Y62_03995 [Clostridia bacterium]|nr:hypothetical protein [Clostridia bacterium]
MSYDIRFKKGGQTCRLPFQAPRGGTYCADPGFDEAWLNMTYNYCETLSRLGIAVYGHEDDPKGTYVLNGRKAGEIAVKLAEAIPQLKDDRDPDYWKATEGNVKKALTDLLTMAVNVPPDAVCEAN